MTRKKKDQGEIDALMAVTALLPWWGGVLLAIVSFFLFRWFATPEIATGLAVHTRTFQ